MGTIKINRRGKRDAAGRKAKRRSNLMRFVALSAAMLCITRTAAAQSATIAGSLGNFDVVNDTGHDAHGFEIELEGLQPNDVYYTFGSQRYGASTVVPTATGVVVHWASAYGNNQFSQSTIAHPANTPFAGSCYMWGANYDTAGCEHFGASLRANATKTTYRWLIEDPAAPGQLIPVDPPVAIPNPAWAVIPPAVAGDPPVVEAEIEAPEPPEAPELYGDAQWVKIFKTQLTRPVVLEELLSDNGLIPTDAAHTEVAWDILQAEPPTNGNQKRHRNQGGIAFDTQSVLRRYELYRYTGAYDPVTHQVVCGGDGTCTAPVDGELGDYVGAQVAAANLQVGSINVTKTGNGQVTGVSNRIRCGSSCVTGADIGTQVSLTAAAASGSTFAGWTGACAGNNATCTVTINGNTAVGATFIPVYTLSLGKSGKGTISGNMGGLNCGKTCSAKIAQGSTVLLSATPETGQFVGWTGACAGTTPTCSVSVTKDTQVGATFSK